MDYCFGVGLALKDIALSGKLLSESFIILDDAIVNNGDFITRVMGMGVCDGGPAVGGPPRMGYSELSPNI